MYDWRVSRPKPDADSIRASRAPVQLVRLYPDAPALEVYQRAIRIYSDVDSIVAVMDLGQLKNQISRGIKNL